MIIAIDHVKVRGSNNLDSESACTSSQFECPHATGPRNVWAESLVAAKLNLYLSSSDKR